MGLTIHFSLHTKGSDEHARKLIRALHSAAQDLAFRELSPVVEFHGAEADFNQSKPDDEYRWLKIQARGSLWKERPDGGSIGYDVIPECIVGFSAWPGEGCESMEVGLATYPASIDTHEGPMPTKLSGWCWRGFVKSQYAANPDCGGVPNFLRCHLTVVALLDAAKKLKCLKRVCDEGEYWQNRDLQKLTQEVGEWNEMIAGLAGQLKDFADSKGLSLEAAITQYPDFEHLEAQANERHSQEPSVLAAAQAIHAVACAQVQPPAQAHHRPRTRNARHPLRHG